MNPTFRPLLGEFIGTFTLVFIGTSVATLQGFFDMVPQDGSESASPSAVPSLCSCSW